ncbi:MAG: heavy metal-associated domain-containing protein [Pseudomonadota bacterium]
MEDRKFKIQNISCGHCVRTIERELGEIDGVKKVEGDQETKEVSVAWDSPATLETILATLREINYPAGD